MTCDTLTKNTWIRYTGASCHMTNLADGMFETTYINGQVKVENSTKMNATKIGKWSGVIYQKDGTKKNIVLDKVKLGPELWTNLFSIGTLLKKQWNLSNEEPIISLSKNNFNLSFDRFFLTKDCLIMGININSSSGASIERNSVSPLKAVTLIDINVLHFMLGHA